MLSPTHITCEGKAADLHICDVDDDYNLCDEKRSYFYSFPTLAHFYIYFLVEFQNMAESFFLFWLLINNNEHKSVWDILLKIFALVILLLVNCLLSTQIQCNHFAILKY